MSSYTVLVDLCRQGVRLPPAIVKGILADTGKTKADLLDDAVLAPRGARPGDPCQQCGGRVKVYCSKRTGTVRIQYMKCGKCGWKPKYNTRRVPLP